MKDVDHWCPRCKLYLPIELFWRSPTTGRTNAYCRPCNSDYARENDGRPGPATHPVRGISNPWTEMPMDEWKRIRFSRGFEELEDVLGHKATWAPLTELAQAGVGFEVAVAELLKAARTR